jgi:hypothetical protein
MKTIAVAISLVNISCNKTPQKRGFCYIVLQFDLPIFSADLCKGEARIGLRGMWVHVEISAHSAEIRT